MTEIPGKKTSDQDRPHLHKGFSLSGIEKHIIFPALLLIIAVACRQAAPLVTIDGSRITIDAGNHHIEGILEPESRHHFILKDEGISINTFAGDAFITMLPLETADQLRAHYGDFFRCNQPGAIQALQKMQASVLVAGRENSKRALSEALALVKKSHIPVVQFIGSRIQVTKQTTLNMEVQDRTAIRLYYLKDFSILKKDYLP